MESHSRPPLGTGPLHVRDPPPPGPSQLAGVHQRLVPAYPGVDAHGVGVDGPQLAGRSPRESRLARFQLGAGVTNAAAASVCRCVSARVHTGGSRVVGTRSAVSQGGRPTSCPPSGVWGSRPCPPSPASPAAAGFTPAVATRVWRELALVSVHVSPMVNDAEHLFTRALAT